MRRQPVRAGWLLLAVWLILFAQPAWAQKSADILRIAWREAVSDFDPFHVKLRNGLVLTHLAFDGLIWRDPDTFTIKPLLAASWKYIDDTTIEFQLRPDAVFQNGDRVTAADVVYTVNIALSDPDVAVPSNYAWLAGAEALDATHVRIRLKRVFPAALEYIALALPILPQSYREYLGPELFSRHPIGAGPYRIVVASGERILLDRFGLYPDTSPKQRAQIAHIAITQVGSPDAEIGALLDGNADWIWSYAPDNSEKIAANPALQEVRAESMRLTYLSFDAAGRSQPDGPLTKLKVRQAIMAAIDRTAIARAVLPLGGRVVDSPCFPTQFGCDQTAAPRVAFDLARARALLAEAGYPDGFDTEIVSYLLPHYALDVEADLARIGIRARVIQLPSGEAIARAAAGQAPLLLGSWGSTSINDVSAILPVFFGGGDLDYARLPELEALIEQGNGSPNPDKRRAFYSRAIRMIGDQALWLPLHTGIATYAFSRNLIFRPSADEIPLFSQASWK